MPPFACTHCPQAKVLRIVNADSPRYLAAISLASLQLLFCVPPARRAQLLVREGMDMLGMGSRIPATAPGLNTKIKLGDEAVTRGSAGASSSSSRKSKAGAKGAGAKKGAGMEVEVEQAVQATYEDQVGVCPEGQYRSDQGMVHACVSVQACATSRVTEPLLAHARMRVHAGGVWRWCGMRRQHRPCDQPCLRLDRQPRSQLRRPGSDRFLRHAGAAACGGHAASAGELHAGHACTGGMRY